MFFLRCAFWLSLMYASVSWGADAMRGPHAFSAAAVDELQGMAATSVARATDWCAEQPTRCARDAARLTALVETATSTPDIAGDEPTLLAEEAALPMPVPDPRRRAAHAVLTERR